MTTNTIIWDYAFDKDNPEVFYKVNTATGEVLDQGTYKPVFNGDRIITAEQQAAWENYRKKEEKKTKRRDISKKNGAHYFVPRLQSFPDLKPQTAARLIYLLTYADYSERGSHLKLTQKTEMKKKDLKKELRLSVDAVDDFLSEVCPAYLTVDENGCIAATVKSFKRGSLRDGKSHHRFYDRWVRSLYRAVPSRKHRHLGYIFQLLPYISIEYNVLCYNQLEEDTAKIEFMSLGDFCEKIGFDKSHAERLLKIYQQLRFSVTDDSGTHMERFVSITYDGQNRHNAKVFVNPRILYSGAHPEQVELLACFSKD